MRLEIGVTCRGIPCGGQTDRQACSTPPSPTLGITLLGFSQLSTASKVEYIDPGRKAKGSGGAQRADSGQGASLSLAGEDQRRGAIVCMFPVTVFVKTYGSGELAVHGGAGQRN